LIRQKEPNYLVFFCYTIVHTSFITCPWLDELREQSKSKQQIRRRRKEKQSWLLYSYCYYYKILSSKSRNSRVNNNNNNDDKGKKNKEPFVLHIHALKTRRHCHHSRTNIPLCHSDLYKCVYDTIIQREYTINKNIYIKLTSEFFTTLSLPLSSFLK